MSAKTVLVTGGSGYIGSHVIVAALQKGYKVRTTVRSLAKADAVRKNLHNGNVSDELAQSVEFVEVDLLGDKGWDNACDGVDYVLHVASPFPLGKPKHEDDIIKPAREGTLRALQAAKKAGTVKRVVITSSVAAVACGHGGREFSNPFTEADWTAIDDPNHPVGAYEKSKTLAEKAAWKWLEDEGKEAGIEIATVNPVLVAGPSLGNEVNTSLELPVKMLNGAIPGLPDLSFGIVDVRDVADLHIKAMESPNAAGQRYLAISDEPSVSAKEIATFLKEGLPAKETKSVPTRVLPNFLLKLAAPFDKSIALVVPDLGVVRPATNAKARKELGWEPRSAKQAILDSVESLKRAGRIKG